MPESLIRHVALVSESARASQSDLMVVAAALQKQATRDLAPIWSVAATVDSFHRLEDVPLDYWPIIIMDNINVDNAAGVHRDDNGQPFALVTAEQDRDGWSLTASHEACEMLVDPFGSHLVAGDSIMEGQGRVNYLVEVCDPSEDARFGYRVNGVRVSDFYTPRFFDPVGQAGVRYSYTGALDGPRMTVANGYLSWMDLSTQIWWQQVRDSDGNPEYRELGRLDASQNLRSQIDRITARKTAEAVAYGRDEKLFAGRRLATSEKSFEGRAAALRDRIGKLLA